MSRREEILREVRKEARKRYGKCVGITDHEMILADRIVELEEKLEELEHFMPVVVERDTLRARCAELERDRERLDWLERFDQWGWKVDPSDGEVERCGANGHATLRAAIDAASAAKVE